MKKQANKSAKTSRGENAGNQSNNLKRSHADIMHALLSFETPAYDT